MNENAENVIGVPTDEQALAAVGGGDRELHPEEAQRVATDIQEAAKANAQWRASLTFEQQMALANVPTVTVPPAEQEQESEANGNPSDQTGTGGSGWFPPGRPGV